MLVGLIALLSSIGLLPPASATPPAPGAKLRAGHRVATSVVRWSPFNSASELRPTLKLKALAKGDCSADSEATGFAYRCTSGNLLLDPCWPDGSDRTEYAICVSDPWARTAYRARVPRLLLEAGVMFGKLGTYPWAIELQDGNRCVLLHGAHDVAPTPHGQLVVDYFCHHGIVLLRDLRRGRVWKIAASHWVHHHYAFVGDRKIKRVYLGGLPPPLRRENSRARSAIAPARRAVRREHPSAGKRATRYVDRIRLTLPDATWTRVEFLNAAASKRTDAVLRFVDGGWVETLEYEPYCEKLPPDVRQQLFTRRDCAIR